MINEMKFVNIHIGALVIFLFALNISVSHSSSNVTKSEKNEQQITRCRNWQFQCKNGQCIAKPFVCDGLKDCKDASDETYEQCQNKTVTKCDEQFFRCKYGACIEKKYLCDGQKQCVDESDESPEICNKLNNDENTKTKKRNRRNTNQCSAPSSSADKTLKFVCSSDPSQNCKPVNGLFPEFTAATVTCAAGYFLEKDEDSAAHVCFKKKWSPPINKCLKKCEALNPVNVLMQCYRDGVLIKNCDENTVLLTGTTVRPECKPTYRYDSPPSYHEITCDEDGKWDNSLRPCVPECGRPYTPAQLTIAGGKKEEVGGSPWQVAIYNKKILICGGTIISEYLVISAAHCFSDGTNDCEGTECAGRFEVVVGKYTSSYNAKDNPSQRTMKIKEIRFPQKGYFAVTTYYAGDIAILILQDPIPISPVVLPACINWVNLRNGVHPTEGTLGKISGWGRTENGTLSTILRTLDLPFIGHRQCVNMVERTFKPFITFDKICAGTGNKSGPTALDGDSGGGLLFEDRELFYLQGVISVKSSSSNSVTVFTDLSEHIDWIASVRNEPTNTKKRLLNEIVNHLKARRFAEAEKKLEGEGDETYYKAVHESYIDNFDLLLDFGDFIDDRERKFKILNALYEEIISSGQNDVKKFMRVRQSLKKGILDRSSGALATENVYRYLKDSIVKAAVGPISSAFENDNSWSEVKELAGDIANNCTDCISDLYKAVVDKIWSSVPMDDILRRAQLNLKYLTDEVEMQQAVMDKLKLADALHTSFIITQAKHMKKTMDSTNYSKMNSDKKSQHEKMKNEIPESVRNLVFSSAICIKNTKYNEYLYSGISSEDVSKSKEGNKVGHQVYTWISTAGDPKPNFKWRVSYWEKLQVHFIDDNFKEYLYVGEDKYDDKLRNVFTWNTSTINGNLAWDIDVDGNYIRIKDKWYNEYLFADSDKKKDSNRRQVFTDISKNKTSGSQWHIDNCS